VAVSTPILGKMRHHNDQIVELPSSNDPRLAVRLVLRCSHPSVSLSGSQPQLQLHMLLLAQANGLESLLDQSTSSSLTSNTPLVEPSRRKFENASILFVGFGGLIDNNIKELISLPSVMLESETLTLTKTERYIYNRVVGPKPITQRHPTAIQRHGNSNTTTVKTIATTNVD
jgi:hypothetical protein